MRSVRCFFAKWRRQRAVSPRDREIQRAIDAVSPGTLQDEARALAQTQFNR
jgi:hypothetical protein